MIKTGKKKKLKKRIAALEKKVRIIKDSVNAGTKINFEDSPYESICKALESICSEKSAPEMRPSKKPISDVDVIADKVLKKIFARAADEIKNPIANPFDYSANDDNT